MLRLSLVLILLTGCTTALTSQGRQVRQIPAQVVPACEFLGIVSGRSSLGFDAAADADNALNEVRNTVAELGGNAFVLNQSVATLDGSSAQAEAYRCAR